MDYNRARASTEALPSRMMVVEGEEVRVHGQQDVKFSVDGTSFHTIARIALEDMFRICISIGRIEVHLRSIKV